MTLIEAVELSSSATSINLLDIPQDYTDLMLQCRLRGSSDKWAGIRLNNDGGFVYSYSVLWADGATTDASANSSNSYIDLYPINYTGTTPSTSFGSMQIVIPNYTTSNNPKTIGAEGVATDNGTDVLQVIHSAEFARTTAITRISFIGDTFQAGSKVYLYGIS